MNFARRVVVDTGVLVSAAIRPESIPALALEKALLLFEVCASAETLAELDTVLLREKFDRYAPRAERVAFIAGLRERVTVVAVTQVVTDCPDPKDNMFLALADTATTTEIGTRRGMPKRRASAEPGGAGTAA